MSAADPNRTLSPDTATHSVLLACFDDDHKVTAPPSEVLDVSIVGSLAFLRLSAYEETAARSPLPARAR